MANEPEEFSPELRAAFEQYPRPTGDTEFDARFWRELDARHNRYRGLTGFGRRLVEIEIEGIAVWRLGFSLLGGASVCGLGVALLSLGGAPTPQSAPQIARTEQIPTAMPRYARELDEPMGRLQPALEPRAPAKKEVSSCHSLAKGWA